MPFIHRTKSCSFAHIRDLRRIRNTLDHSTTCTIATSLIHSKLDYCNSLFLNLNCQQTNRLQLILNSTARAVTKHLNTIISLLISNLFTGSKSHNAYNTKFSLTYKSLQFKQPSSILDLLKIQPTHSTRSSAVVTLQRPSNPSRLLGEALNREKRLTLAERGSVVNGEYYDVFGCV